MADITGIVFMYHIVKPFQIFLLDNESDFIWYYKIITLSSKLT